jgi:hypothetical protein
MKTKSGREARVICTDRKGFNNFPVLALIKNSDGQEIGVMYHSDLTSNDNHHFPDEDLDLIEDI